MEWRTGNAPLFYEAFDSEQGGYSSNMKLMMIVAALLIMIIGFVLVQPYAASHQVAEHGSNELTKTADLASTTFANYSNSESAATRSETFLVFVSGVERAESVGKILRHPIRFNGKSRDIRALSR